MRPEILFPLFQPITSLAGVGPRLAKLFEHRGDQGVIRNTDTDGPTLRVLQHLWQLPSGWQDKGVRSRCQRLDEPECPVIDLRIDANLGKITANQREVVFLVGFANPVNSIDGLLVTDTASEGIARIGRVRDQVPIPNAFHDLPDPTRLRVTGVNFDQLGHARIVGEQNVRA